MGYKLDFVFFPLQGMFGLCRPDTGEVVWDFNGHAWSM